jgi:hypothetical protein
MTGEILQQITSDFPADISDELEVFLYTNLTTIITPNQSVVLTPAFQAGLQEALNSVGSRHSEALPKDLKDVLDVFILTNLKIIVDEPTAP